MKKLFLVVVLSFCVLSVFSIPLPDGSDARITEIRQNGNKIVYVKLKEPTVLNTPLGRLEAVNEVLFYESGRMKQFQPASGGSYESPVGMLAYAASPISFYESGSVESLDLETVVTITGSVGRLSVSPKGISFYDRWIPASVELAAECQVKLKSGLVFARAGYRMYFHETGAIQSFTVSKSDPLESSIGTLYPQEGSELELHQNGRLASVVPEDICMIRVDGGAYFTRARTPVVFKDDGSILRFSVEAQDFVFGQFRFTLEHGSPEMVVYGDSSVFFPNPGYVHLAGLNFRHHCNGLFVAPKHNRLIYWEENYNDILVYNYSYDANGRLVSTSLNMNILQYTPETMRFFEHPVFTFDQESNITSYLGFEKRWDKATNVSYNHPVIVRVTMNKPIPRGGEGMAPPPAGGARPVPPGERPSVPSGGKVVGGDK